MNETIEKFGYPQTLVREYEHWLVLLRPAQSTLGSLVLAAKSDATEFHALPEAAFAEMKAVVSDIEAALKSFVDYAKLNYLMLMMVDPNVHYHVIPRYEGARQWNGLSFTDAGWPRVPDLAQAITLSGEQVVALVAELQGRWG